MAELSPKVISLPKDELSMVREMGLQREAEGKKTIHMERGEPDFATPKPIIDAAYEAGLRGETHYPDMQGIPQLREALAHKVQKKNNLQASKDNIVVTIGGMHGLYCTFQTILTPEDEVVVLAPYWLSTSKLIALSDSAGPVFLEFYTKVALSRYSPEAFRRDLEAVITPKTKAIYLNTPNNPTGVVLGMDYLEVIADIARTHKIFVVSDEAYEDIVFDGMRHISIASLPGMRDLTFSVFTFSKSYAMTGLRLGYVVGPEDIIHKMTYGPVIYTTNGIPTPIQFGGLAALEKCDNDINRMRAAYERRRDILYEGLIEVKGLNPIKPHGAFYMFVEASKWGRGIDLVRRFLDAGVAVAPGSAFGGKAFDGWVRFSLANADEEIALAVDFLKKAFGTK